MALAHCYILCARWNEFVPICFSEIWVGDQIATLSGCISIEFGVDFGNSVPTLVGRIAPPPVIVGVLVTFWNIISVRSGPTYPIQEWNKNWDFREPYYTARSASPDRQNVPSLAEHFGEVREQKPGSDTPSAIRHLVFIRHGQYVKGKEDKDKILTHRGRFVLDAPPL
jgi:hypothetical protein